MIMSTLLNSSTLYRRSNFVLVEDVGSMHSLKVQDPLSSLMGAGCGFYHLPGARLARWRGRQHDGMKLCGTERHAAPRVTMHEEPGLQQVTGCFGP